MTMKERISASVRDSLRSAVDGQRKEEIVEELSANLYAKYEDLVKTGADPEEAYGQAMDTLGDVSELVELAGGSRLKAGLDSAADSLAGMGRTVADGVMNAVRAAKEPLKDMGSRIAQAVKDLEIDVTVHNQHQFDYTVPAEGVTGLDVQLRSGDVSIHTWDEDVIQVIERSKSNLDEDKHASFLLREDGVLCVEQGNTVAGFTFFGMGLFSSDFEIFLPRKLWRSVSVSSTNGDVIFEDVAQVGTLLLSTTNGDIDLGEGVGCDTLEAKSVSGDIQSRALTCRSCVLKTTSGDLELEFTRLPDEMETKSVSGDVNLVFPENDGFAVAYQKVSGDFDSDFDLVTSLSRKSGTATYKGAQAPLYHISTVSGDLSIDRA